MIKIHNLTKKFDDRIAVNDLNIDIQPGEIVGFLGPNGAGKTTTMKMITGFLTPCHGNVNLFGHDIRQDPITAKRLIGYVPEGAPLYGEMTVQQYLNFVAEMRGFFKVARTNAVQKMVDTLHLANVLHQPIDTLSKGFKRRVGLAQAMIHDPQILILDEPTDGLDPNQKQHVRNLIRTLSQDKNKIVIISTHILEEVDAVCTRALIIHEGNIVADDTPENLCKQSQYNGAVVLELTEKQDILKELSAMKDVVEVSQDPDFLHQYRILPKKGKDFIHTLMNKVQKNSWPIAGIHSEKGRLEDTFKALTNANADKQEAS